MLTPRAQPSSPFIENARECPQKLAADPRVSSWVSASAGTGKTKVLTDRLLNLMLMGTDPSKILCLTFTKAAAAEMQTRLFDKLRQWVLLSDEELTSTLTELTHQAVTPILLTHARSLFTQVLDLVGGIKILTIHSFCQTILSRFPLEADIPPHFTILDDAQADQYLSQATKGVLDGLEGEMIDNNILWGISHFFKDSTFQDSLEELLSQRSNLRALVTRFPTLQSYQEHLCDQLNLDTPNLCDPQAEQKLIERACQDLAFDKIGLLEILQSASDPDSASHRLLAQWLESTASQRLALLDDYCRLYLTKDGSPLKKPKVDHPAEGERLIRLFQKRNALGIAQKTLTLFSYGQRIFQDYQSLKANDGMLDYDDLIEKTVTLLNTPNTAAWVLYKLDGGIDHILIDEAQDTNPPQWQVILSLADDFFRSDKAHRTLFVVGDAKQSIYSFQGAKPEDFVTLRSHFSTLSQNIGQTWRDINLSVSFRSTPKVLELVDRVFANDSVQRQVLATEQIVHKPFRQNHVGNVALWPLILKEEKEEALAPWTLPNRQIQNTSLPQELAQKLANQILVMLNRGDILPSTGQPIQPKDILILVKTRSELVTALIRELKKKNIPVAGADRFLLTNHIAAQDLIVLGEFLLQPLDDLALATVLRSPFINMEEQDLEDLCFGREGSLWGSLIQQADKREIYGEAYQWLKKIMTQQDYLPPFELYTFILTTMGGRDLLLERLSLEAEDAINEFLNQALQFERKHQVTLQAFLGFLKTTRLEIKRDSADQQMNQIRIMTIHGSKGLQAPVVIIPEKVDARDRPEKILWEVNRDGVVELMVARPAVANDCDLTMRLKDEQLQRDDAEDKRLLYVALTRAQDNLYLCGYGNKQSGDSWYTTVLSTLGQPEPWEAPESDSEYAECGSAGDMEFPHYLREACMRVTIESPEEEEKAHDFASDEAGESGRLRGILIHKLLEDLPLLPESQRQQGAMGILRMLGYGLTPETQSYIDLVLSILTNEKFSCFYGADSISELEVMRADGSLIRLDRIVLSTDPSLPIKILDYKSASHPPAFGAEIPVMIRDQMEGYKTALSSLYPDREIECYILWTSIGRLDRV